jgi:hypothetical protein
MFACIASHRSAEPGMLVVQVGFAARDELIATDPATYFLKDHYLNYPVVLVRLRRVHRDALRDLLRMAWEFVGTRAASRRTASLGPRRLAAARKRPMSR